MSSEFTVNAKARTDVGKGASRRLRRLAAEVPAIIYGGDKAPQMISIAHKDLLWFLEDEAFFSSVLTMDIDGNNREATSGAAAAHPLVGHYRGEACCGGPGGRSPPAF